MMGHTRLGPIPKTRKWSDLVQQVASTTTEGGYVATAESQIDEIAGRTLDAARKALERAVSDAGVQHTFYLLTQVALASRTQQWQTALARLGVHLSNESTVFDLTAGLQDAVDRHISQTVDGSTDFSEMAQQAAGEAITGLAGPRAVTLFGTSSAEVQNAIRSLSTKKGFSELGQRFFGRFVARFLNFYLSRITAGALGSKGLQQLGDVTRFDDALKAHCDQSARIVRDFCGEWYSKTEYEKGIDPGNASRFLAVALRKLGDELEQQKAGS